MSSSCDLHTDLGQYNATGLTVCFEDTAVLWTVSLLFWVSAGLRLLWSSAEPKHPLSRLSVVKVVSACIVGLNHHYKLLKTQSFLQWQVWQKKKNEVKTKVHFSVQLTASCLFGECPKSFANEMWLGAAVLYHCSESGKCMKKLLTELSPAGVYNCSVSNF